MPKRRSFFLLAICVMWTHTGCFWFTSKDDGEVLEKEIIHLKNRIEQLESEQAEKQQHLTEMISRARGEVDKLEQALTKATRILSRNSADFGTDMETMKEHLRKVDGFLAEIRYDVNESKASVSAVDKKIQEFALAAGVDMPIDGTTVPNDEKKHLDMIKAAYAKEGYSECRALADLFLERYPKSKSADLAQLHVARSYFVQKRWAKALGALKDFTDKYPQSLNTPEVLYEMAFSFFSLGDCTDAKLLIEALLTKHKDSEYAAQAKELRELIKKNKARCTS